MKGFKLALCLVFIFILGLTGCDKKVEPVFKSEETPQTSSSKIEDSNYQKPEEKVNEAVQPSDTKAANIENNKHEKKEADKYKKYLGYWQLSDRDLKNNDVIRGFNVPLKITGISNIMLNGSLSFRMNDNYHMNPVCTIKLQEEIKDNKVSFDFNDRLFGSGNGVLTLNDETIEVEIKLKEKDENAPFSFEGRWVYKKIPGENLKITTIPKNLFSYLEFSKEEMISALGADYEIVAIDHRAFKTTGYFYPKYGLTFEFEDKEGNYISCISCDEIVEINGARAKMNFEQIQQYLGKQDVIKVIDERIPEEVVESYELFYRINNTSVRFDSPSEDGKDSVLTISGS